MKRVTLGVAAGVLLLLGVAAVAGVGTARAAATPKTYCLDNQTFTTADGFEISVLDRMIDSFGGTATSAEIVQPEGGPDPDAAEEGGSLFDFIYNDADADDFGDYGTFSLAQIEARVGGTVTDVRIYHVANGACASPSPQKPQQPPAREAYCSVAGNTNPFSGSPIAPGTFLDLLAGQANTDSHYTGAVPAFWVEGVGLTCSLTPAQAALAAASSQRVGAAGDPEIPIPGIPDYAIYTYIPAK